MTDTKKDADPKVYEIGYLLVSSISQEKVIEAGNSLKGILSKSGASLIQEGAPELQSLAYTMIKKIGSANHRFDHGYFGWFKFEATSDKIESIKKSFEAYPEMLRMILLNTIRENTYLGKKAPVAQVSKGEENIQSPESVPAVEVTPATIEEMDKSIDEMVKES